MQNSPQPPAQQQNRDQMQMNAVRKINSLLQSGTVSVTQSSQNSQFTKVVKKQYGASGVQITNQIITTPAYKRCFVCDELVQGSTAHLVVDTSTSSTHTRLTNKIARLVGEGYMVLIGTDDLICRRCFNLFNLMDKAESEVDRFKGQINTFLNKKYNMGDTDTYLSNSVSTPTKIQSPPVKMQKLNTGLSRINQNSHDASGAGMQVRKVGTANNSSLDQEISSPPKPKGPTKLYKCMSCDYKSTDLTSFDPHYQECKGTQTAKTATQPSVTKKLVTQPPQVHSCTMCQYKTADKNSFDEHLKKHYKMRPFKCRICTQRFETREQAQVHAKTHQPDYFKCGMCAATFNRRDLLMKHLETHEKSKNQQIQMVSSVQPVATTQKLLQDTIDEALRDPGSDAMVDPKNIRFHSCDICSVTFLNEGLYMQHMKQHKTSAASSSGSTKTNNGSYSQEEQVKLEGGGTSGVSDDLESIFERMHSEKTEATQNSDNLVITSQENANTGEITFNITIPQQGSEEGSSQPSGGEGQQGASIDMPTLDVGEENDSKVNIKIEDQQMQAPPVSMPSLDDDQETQQSHQSNTEAVPMELDEIQGGGDGQQVKFILNENGQLLSLDNHILTTDMDGNQILVQGTDMEQLQALLQSGGIVMQGEEGMAEGQTLQMLAGDGQNQQMVIIQGPDGQEAHMIDASLIDADGKLLTLNLHLDFSTLRSR